MDPRSLLLWCFDGSRSQTLNLKSPLSPPIYLPIFPSNVSGLPTSPLDFLNCRPLLHHCHRLALVPLSSICRQNLKGDWLQPPLPSSSGVITATLHGSIMSLQAPQPAVVTALSLRFHPLSISLSVPLSVSHTLSL